MKAERTVFFDDWGLISYQKAFLKQSEIFDDLINQKVQLRNHPDYRWTGKNHFILCEHPHVITLGKSGDAANLLFNEEVLKSRGVEFYHTNRGGDITYHGPGQIVGYPILDLEQFNLTIHQYVYLLEEVIISTLKYYNIEAGRLEGMTGVWLESEHPVKARKICAIGVKASRHITMHGFAFNINTCLDYFNLIVPCGISGKGVTSLQKELGKSVPPDKVKKVLLRSFETYFKALLIY